jgi:hypothetical protein
LYAGFLFVWQLKKVRLTTKAPHVNRQKKGDRAEPRAPALVATCKAVERSRDDCCRCGHPHPFHSLSKYYKVNQSRNNHARRNHRNNENDLMPSFRKARFKNHSALSYLNIYADIFIVGSEDSLAALFLEFPRGKLGGKLCLQGFSSN